MNDSKGTCEICGSEAQCGLDGTVRSCRCPRCGTFEYDAAIGCLVVDLPDHLVRLSGWVREQNDAGVEFPRITPEISRRVTHMQRPRLRERTATALMLIARECPSVTSWYYSQEIALMPELLGRSYSFGLDDSEVLIRLLVDQGYLNENNGLIQLSSKGFLEVEEWSAAGRASNVGFVAMSFSAGLTDAWLTGFAPAIRSAGYTPVRIDSMEFVGGISDRIMSEIRRSRFVVADYTDQKGGVYFEAGFALGLGIPVIPTCRASEVDQLHFDIKHLNTLLWTTPDVLRDALSKRISAILGPGPGAAP